mmetsp:Transcript_3637/g.10322  ORF Transcript_3637/g.10322 Transcript_3637/m.10322 type:complete len:626 (+) Transcript_3637:172-2049(+)
MNYDGSFSRIGDTFLASIRSVGTACTLAAVGIYLHRRGFVVGDGKRTLALISQQVTIPLFLFTKIIYCNQDWSDQPCPDVTKSLQDVWILLFWPAYVVGVGLCIGWAAARVAGTPKRQVRAVLAACGFGNSTGLPITLLSVVHANFPATSDLGAVDPCLFLSVYLLLYPVLQWGIGGWLLAPDGATLKKKRQKELDAKAEEERIKMNRTISEQEIYALVQMRNQLLLTQQGRQLSLGLAHNVLNNRTMEEWYKHSRSGMMETDASLYMSFNDNLSRLAVQSGKASTDTLNAGNGQNGRTSPVPKIPELSFNPLIHRYSDNEIGMMMDVEEEENEDATESEEIVNTQQMLKKKNSTSFSSTHATPFRNEQEHDDDDDDDRNPNNEQSSLLPTFHHHDANKDTATELMTRRQSISSSSSEETDGSTVYENETLCNTLSKIASRCLQPPVVGAVAGMCIAATPLRGIFVDLVDRSDSAPLEWLFDGLYAVGQAAVPINMMILGCNLSASYLQQTTNPAEAAKKLLSKQTMLAIVIGKMFAMPAVGFLSVFLLRTYVLNIPDAIDGSFYLVMMIVFLTPTANNVMVMVELSGSGSKEGIATVIAYEYMAAPLILSLTMTAAVGMASHWS